MRFLFLFFLVGYKLIAFSNPDTSFINVNRLKYSSQFEETQFKQLNNTGKFDALNFLFCLDSTVTVEKAEKMRDKLNTFYDKKLAAVAANKNADKALKGVFKEIHENLLTKYVKDARFEKLLDNGEYNCVTASALYALTFEHLHIPYQLRSTIEHVYVIVNPGPDQTIIETTDPVNGVVQFDAQFKKQFVAYMVKEKLIGMSEVAGDNIDELFQKYYFKADTINLLQLIGFHYYNCGIDYLLAKDYSKATNQLMKAYYLNRKEQVANNLIVALAGCITETFDITDTNSLNAYFTLEKMASKTDDDYLYGGYESVSEELAIRQDQMAKYETVSAFIFSNIHDSTSLVKFKTCYYYTKGRAANLQKNMLLCFENLWKCLCINGKDLRIRSLYDETLTAAINQIIQNDNISKIDTIIQLINSNNCNDSLTKHTLVVLKLCAAGYHFAKSAPEKGSASLDAAEAMINKYSLTGIAENFVEYAYTAAEKHYYVSYDISTAKQYVKRGLKNLP